MSSNKVGKIGGSIPIASVVIKDDNGNYQNYVFYYSNENTLTWLRGMDSSTYSATTVAVDSNEVRIPDYEAPLAATAWQDNDGNPRTLRVYYVDSSHYIRELIGDFNNGSVAWRVGGLTDKRYQINLGSGLSASSGKNGTLRVFFVSKDNTTKITEAYFTNAASKWESKVL